MAAINQNIFGYMTVDPVDWSKSTNELSKTLFDIGERRETEKENLDKMKMDNLKLVQQSDVYSSQTFGQKMTASAQIGRDNIKAWNDALKRGELSPDDYKLRMNNFTETWGLLGNSIKGFDAKYAELQKQINDGDASQLTVEAGQYFAQLGELKNLEVFIDPETGTVSTGRLDPKTGQIIPDSIESAKSIADPSNAVFDKVNLDDQVYDISKTFGKVVTENGLVTTKDARNNPAFQSKLDDVQGALTSNNRLTASILVDNIGDGYTTYFTTQERDQKAAAMIDKENRVREKLGLSKLSGSDLDAYMKEVQSKLIPMQKDSSGVYQPMLSEQQVNRAKDAIEDTLYMQLGFERIEDEPRVGSAGTGSKSEDLKFFNLAQAAKQNWNSSEGLSGLSKDYDFKWDPKRPGKLIVYKQGSDGRGGIQLTEVGSVKSLNELGPYLGVSTGQLDNWAKSIGAVQSTTPAPAAKPKTPPKQNITQDQFNAQWAKLKPGQTLKGPDGKIYKKQ